MMLCRVVAVVALRMMRVSEIRDGEIWGGVRQRGFGNITKRNRSAQSGGREEGSIY